MEHHERGSSAAQASAAERAGLQSLAGSIQSSETVGEKVAEHRRKIDLAEALSAGDLMATAQRDAHMPNGGEDEEADLDMMFATFGVGSSAAPAPAAKSAPLPKQPPPDRSPVVRQTRQRKNTGSDLAPMPAATLSTATPPGPVGGAAGGDLVVIQRAQRIFEEKRASFSDQAIWEGKVKKRPAEQCASLLEKHASNLIAFPEYSEMVDEMSKLSSTVVRKHALFAELKKDPVPFILELKDEDQQLLRTVSPSLVATILVHTTTHILKDLEDSDSEKIPWFI